MKIEFAPSCPVSIFIAGDYYFARRVCQEFCGVVGLCITVTETAYVYTGGEQLGVIVGLINYPRFPSEPALIEARAVELGMKLREALGQESFSVQTPTTTTWFSWRDASADTHAERCDVEQAQPARVGSAVPEGQTPKGNRR